MDEALTAIADGDRSVLRSGEWVGERGCKPPELIVHYYLDDLSPAEHKDLTDHLSRCNLCSARLLALEVSAELSVLGAGAELGSTFTDPDRFANTSRPARKVVSSQRKHGRPRRVVIPSVDSLGNRELTTTVGLPLDFGALAGVPEVQALKTSVARFRVEPRTLNVQVGAGVRAADPYVWDLAIGQIYGTASDQHLRVTSERPLAAA